MNKKPKGNKNIYILLLIILLALLGIWKCPNILESTSTNEKLVEEEEIQPTDSIQKEAATVDTISTSINKEIDLSTEEHISSIETTLRQEEEELKPLKKTTIQEVVVQKSKRSIDNASIVIPGNSCTTPSILKIDKASFQRCIAFSPDGSTFTVGNNNKYSSIFNIEGKEVAKLIGHKGYVLTTAYSPNGKYIATGSVDKTAKLWDVNTGKLVSNFGGHLEAIYSITFSPNSKSILTGSLDSTAILWDVTSGNKLLQLIGHKLEISTVAFSPNGQYILTGSSDNTAKLWNAKTGEILFSLEHTGAVRSAAFSPNGKLIVTGSGDNKIRVWNVQSGNHILTMQGHKSHIRSVEFSSNGKYILTASGDKTIRLWDLESGIELCKFVGHSSAVSEAKFHPINDKIIVSASNDKTIRMWKIEFE